MKEIPNIKNRIITVEGQPIAILGVMNIFLIKSNIPDKMLINAIKNPTYVLNFNGTIEKPIILDHSFTNLSKV